jgi:hypothetical protein
MKLPAIYAALLLAWLVFLGAPLLVQPLGYAAYAGLALLVLRSAVRHRRPRWVSGLIFGLLLLTLPLWVCGFYFAFEPWAVWPSAWNTPGAKAPDVPWPHDRPGRKFRYWVSSSRPDSSGPPTGPHECGHYEPN